MTCRRRSKERVARVVGTAVVGMLSIIPRAQWARQLVAGDGRVDDLAQAVVAGQWSGLAARPVELIKGAVERGRHARRLFIPEAVGPEEQLDRKGDVPQPEPPHELRRLFRDPPERVVSRARLVEAPHLALGQPDPFQPVALLREVELEDPIERERGAEPLTPGHAERLRNALELRFEPGAGFHVAEVGPLRRRLLRPLPLVGPAERFDFPLHGVKVVGVDPSQLFEQFLTTGGRDVAVAVEVREDLGVVLPERRERGGHVLGRGPLPVRPPDVEDLLEAHRLMSLPAAARHESGERPRPRLR